jgi:serine/threonine protein kinase
MLKGVKHYDFPLKSIKINSVLFIMELINKKYLILNKIGSGSFGSIFKGQNVRTKEFVAIKVERINDELKLLKNESKIYQYLNDCSGIPSVKWFGKDDNNYYMVIDLLGNSLQELKNKLSSFSLALVLKIGVKIILLLKTIHEKGLVHRDIKPDNFLFGQNKLTDLYLIDFGLCKTYLDNDIHIPIKSTHSIIGSFNYASIMSHKRIDLSRRDDLESLGYMLLYFISDNLPWNNESDENEIIKKKLEILNNNRYPHILLDFLRYVRSLEYEEKPNYYLIIDNFKREIDLLSKIN